MTTVADMCSLVTSGGTPSRSRSDFYEGGTIPWIKTGDLRDGPIAQYDEKITALGLEGSSARMLPRGTVLMAMYGATVGRLGWLTEPAACNQASCAMVADPAVCDPRWLFYALKHVREPLMGLASGAAQQNLNSGLIKSCELPDHRLDQQRAIAEVLGALDDKIAANTRLQELTRDLLRTRFFDLRIDAEPEGTDLGVMVDDLIELNPSVPRPDSVTAVYLEMKNVPEKQMTVSTWGYREPKGGARFENGDTVMARITPCLENGKTGYVDFLDAEQVGVGSTEFIVMRARQGIPDALPYFLAKSPRFREHAIRNMVGTSGRQRLAARDLAALKLCAPDQARLTEFGMVASALMKRVKAAVDESNSLAATRDALLPLLMSGKVTVKDAESVVEGVV